jgi:5-methyltetrahydrofolate--homocysteine methyltransferase
VYRLNVEAAKLAKSACNEIMQRDPSRKRYVAGAIGPTNKTYLFIILSCIITCSDV